MSSKSCIPPLLAPFVHAPPVDSLILLTNTVSTSSSWLLVRYLCDVLGSHASQHPNRTRETGADNEEETDCTAVVLVSWMQDYEFWKSEVRRAGALDLALLSQNKRFAFVDGLTEFCVPPPPSASLSTSAALPIRGKGPTPTTVHGQDPARRHGASPHHSTQPLGEVLPPQGGRLVSCSKAMDSVTKYEKLSFPQISTVRSKIMNVISSLVGDDPSVYDHSTQPQNHHTSRKKTLLILDAPDLLLALHPTDLTPQTSAGTSVEALVLSLRLHEKVHCTVINLSADINSPSSTLPPSHIPCSLETESQAFLTSIAHQADLVISCRGLDTGGAEDVSGVLRITRSDVEDEDVNEHWNGQELLYLVRNDGTAKVWERGAGVG